MLTRRQAFLPYLQAGAFDIVQPDVTKVGGISEQRRIAFADGDNGIAFVGYGWNTAVGLAADLQIAAALPTLSAEGFSLDAEGMFAVPDRPGLGVTLEPEALAAA